MASAKAENTANDILDEIMHHHITATDRNIYCIEIAAVFHFLWSHNFHVLNYILNLHTYQRDGWKRCQRLIQMGLIDESDLTEALEMHVVFDQDHRYDDDWIFEELKWESEELVDLARHEPLRPRVLSIVDETMKRIESLLEEKDGAEKEYLQEISEILKQAE